MIKSNEMDVDLQAKARLRYCKKKQRHLQVTFPLR